MGGGSYSYIQSKALEAWDDYAYIFFWARNAANIDRLQARMPFVTDMK